MLTVENTKVEGWEQAIRGMRNPMNSWAKSDSCFGRYNDDSFYKITGELCSADDFPHPYSVYPDDKPNVILGPNDKDLMKRLASAGKDHAKYRRMIIVWCDILAPLYWWKEFDTYKIGTVANSCSTMHKIAEKEFTLDDFSHEHLIDSMYTSFDSEEELEKAGAWTTRFVDVGEGEKIYEGKFAMDILRDTVDALNAYRKIYLVTKDKRYWWQMIQLLPSSYNQRRTVMLNYEVLANIYHARKDHKLDCWHTFCDWAKELPESWIFTGEDA